MTTEQSKAIKDNWSNQGLRAIVAFLEKRVQEERNVYENGTLDDVGLREARGRLQGLSQFQHTILKAVTEKGSTAGNSA